ncbi:MAG TPA: serine/threonine-protein kinase [Gemmatimonadaceae bacterium]|nr:serine/threonine-protein kinase [Gemmatimonadaceae bacterium]
MDNAHPLDAEFLSLQPALAGEYSIERELGRGGMGIVYLAREVQLERLVAIKVLPPALAERPGFRERFLREARTAAQLSHPNIVPIHRVGEAGGFVFFVMAYVDGETLGNRVRTRGPLDAAAAARVMREVAWALAYAHGRGVIHRDVKPDNILIEKGSGRALVTDFGIARVRQAEPESDAERAMGTIAFASPEQMAGGDVDGRSDVYGLGVVGYYIVSGRLPYEARSVPALVGKQLGEAAPPVERAAPGLPPALARAIDRCLHRDPAGRFPGGEALADALEPASIERSELPVPLRAWLTTQNPARTVLLAWAGIAGLTTLVNLFAIMRGGGPSWASVFRWSRLLLGAGATAVPLLTLAAFHFRQTWRALHAGYSVADLRTALARWREIRREEVAFESSETALGPRILRWFTWGSVGALGALIVVAINVGHRSAAQLTLNTLFKLTIWPAGGSLLLSNALGVRLLPRRLRSAMIGFGRSTFWNSGFGAWVGAMLGRGRTAPPQLLNRPTEAALGLAASELFAALPTAYRRDLRALPELVRRLEERAVRIREHVDDLTRLTAEAERDLAPSPDDRARDAVARLSQQRDAARQDLARTIAALESIRLDLLRLHGGVDRADTVTSLLEQARHAERDLGTLIDAQREVHAIAPAPTS